MIKSNLLVLVLICTAILNHSLSQPMIATFIWYLFFIFFILKEKKYRAFLKLIRPLFLILLLGFLLSFGNSTRDIVRDGFYFLNPIVFILLGSMFAINMNFDRFVYFVVKLGALLSFIFVVKAFFLFGINIFNDSLSIRANVGIGNALSAISLVLVLCSNNFKTLHFVNDSPYRKIIIFVNLFAVLLFGSRTYYGVFIISFLCVLYPIVKKYRLRFYIIATAVIVFFVLILSVFKDNIIVGKLINSLTEVTLTTELDPENSYANYRGYEMMCAINTYIDGNIFNYIFGYGFGKLVDLKIYIELAGQEFRYIPLLHNGYLYLLIKTGLVGIILFFSFFIGLIKLSKSIFSELDNLIYLLLLSVILSICFVTFIVNGFANLEFQELLIMLGALIQYVLFEKRDSEIIPE